MPNRRSPVARTMLMTWVAAVLGASMGTAASRSIGRRARLLVSCDVDLRAEVWVLGRHVYENMIAMTATVFRVYGRIPEFWYGLQRNRCCRCHGGKVEAGRLMVYI